MNLVREYVSCMDEISQIHEMSMQKVECLGKLREYYEAIDARSDDERIIRVRDYMTERIDGAARQIQKDNENLPRLMNDLKTSLDVVIISSP